VASAGQSNSSLSCVLSSLVCELLVGRQTCLNLATVGPVHTVWLAGW
jgi:hypothetical protein